MIAFFLGLALTADPATVDDTTSWTIRADHVHTAAGETFSPGIVRVEDGKISAVSGGGGGGDLEVFAVTPGLIDLSIRVAWSSSSVEQSSESTPELRVAEALDLFNYQWDRAIRGGVTTALASPRDENVIGGLGVAVKTAGSPDFETRTVKADAALRASMGSQPANGNRFASGRPADFYVRRPTTRMGTEWVFRKTFYDALAKDPWPPREVRGRDVLDAVLGGELPVTIQANATQDIRTACFLKEEFGIPRVILDGCAEAWMEPELLVQSGVSVVLGPHDFDGRGSTREDLAFFAWHNASLLHENGVPFALSSHGSSDPGARLCYQPGFAMRGGLSFEAALESVTIAPARMIGVESRVGTLEVGKDADLVLWSGEPFQLSSRVVGVIVDGRLVLDPRPSDEESD